MNSLAKITDNISQLPADHLVAVIALAALALAAFAIHAIRSIVKDKGRR